MPGEELPPGIFRIALGLEYDGHEYSGWQKQKGHEEKTVQSAVEKALSYIADHDVKVFCAGRTDAGVHATEQVIHFDTRAERPDKAWIEGVNTHLPADIRSQWCSRVDGNFHARYSAVARTYRYFIWNQPVAPATGRHLLTWERRPLHEGDMHAAAQLLLGENDFSAFRSAACQSHTPWRCVDSVSVQRSGALVIMEITANAFLHHMVRNIVGVLLEIGAGEQDVDWARRLLEGRDRTLAAKTAAPNGLYLYRVTYPQGLPGQGDAARPMPFF
jgi:tRNA pseudouridine38-40 synthase